MEEAKGEGIVVFSVLRPAECTDCGSDLGKGDFLTLEDGKPYCLACADLDHLAFLPSGNVALTRRAKKGSKLWATVLRFSRSRRRYERQGLLVEEEALAAAEASCLVDEDARAAARERAAARREVEDAKYIESFTRAVGDRYPACPPEEVQEIALHACQKYSGRVGRSAMAKAFDNEAIDLAVRAHIRHRHTDYDELLVKGVDRRQARDRIGGEVDRVQDRWRVKR